MGFYGKKVAFIIGNGESRKPIKLDFLREQGVIYGCNALYRDFYPDILVSLDVKMTNEIFDSGYKGCHIYKDLKTKNQTFLINQNGEKVTVDKGWSSGSTAAFLAASCVEFKEIYLIGFDFFKTDFVNNVYKGTPNYVKSNSRPISTVFFREQIKTIMKNSPYKKFIWVNDLYKKIWTDVSNYDIMKVNKFKEKFGC